MRFAATLEAVHELAWGLEAADPAVFFVVLGASPDSIAAALTAELGGPAQVSTIQANGIAWLDTLEESTGPLISIIEGGLSSLSPPERALLNTYRSRLLEAGRKLVLVEPAILESEIIHPDFRDFLPVVREIFHIQPMSLDDHLYDSGDAWPLRAIAARLPAVLTSGGTIIQGGRVHFKQAPQITCPRCGEELRPGRTTLIFRHAPPAQREQAVSGWVCPCGEAYVPGEVARAAHAAAFRHREGS